MSSPVKVIKVYGILGQTQAKQFRQEILDLIATRTKAEHGAGIEILIDFEQAAFMDSSGLGALVSVLKAVKSVQGKISLCAVRQEIKMLLELANVIQHFPIFSDQADFYQARESCSVN